MKLPRCQQVSVRVLTAAGIVMCLAIAGAVNVSAEERSSAGGQRSGGEQVQAGAQGSAVEQGHARAQGSTVEQVHAGAQGGVMEQVHARAQGSTVEQVHARTQGSPVEQVHAGAQGSVMTGNLRVDLFGLGDLNKAPVLQQDPSTSPMPSRKSLWLAGGLSLLLPGAGEFYAQSYWKAAIFLALEVVAIGVAYSYDQRGDQQTDDYRAFADGHWSVVKYAKYAETLQPGRVYTWRIPGTEGMGEFDHPWTQVNWAELNRLEKDIQGYYSHTLPPYGDQQYYELIGKYPQFNQGWIDAPASFNYGDVLTPNFLYYAGERGKANDFYTSATRWVTVVLINHFLSAADAVWSASIYNRAHASVGMRMLPSEDGYSSLGFLKISYSL